MKEIWKIINTHPYYEVSNFGRVRCWKGRGQYGKKLSIPRIRIILPNKGYPSLALHSNGKRTRYRIHKLVLEAFKGPAPKGMQTRHLDGNKNNNNLYNLVWGTAKENIHDNIRLGKDNKGEKHGNNRNITKNDVLQIRDLYSTGKYSQFRLAKMFKTTQGAIKAIVHKDTWQWLNNNKLFVKKRI